MLGEQTLAGPVLADQDPRADPDPAAMRAVAVPEVWPPLDGVPSADVFPSPAPGPDDGGRSAPANQGPPWTRQFAVLLAEALAGARPLRQVLPWMSERGSMQLRRALPLFGGGHRPRILRVLTAAPSPDVIEMTLIVAAGPRTRAVAVRLERSPQAQRRTAPPWLCTDIEAA
jgi:Family of unknown function (DUF6459)